MVIMEPKKVKARYRECYDNKTCKIKTYYELPTDAASLERMVEQVAEGILSVRNGAWTTVDLSRAALAAIGIKGGKL